MVLSIQAKGVLDRKQRQRKMWKLSATKARISRKESWIEINALPTVTAKRFRYSPRKGIWTEDEIQIKIETRVSVT